MMSAFRLLSKFKGLRGTTFDIFGYTKDRKRERALITEYEVLIYDLIAKITPKNYDIAVELASLPEHIRGYGHVKERHLQDVKLNEAVLRERFEEKL